MLELIKERYSVRKFKDQPIEEEKLAKILEVAKYAPTAVNKQPHKIYVIKSDEAISKIDTVTQCRYGAPVVLMFCFDKETALPRPFVEGQNLGETDATIVCDEVMLAAWSLGIGSCWVAAFNPENAKKTFNLPENMVPVALLPIGYADCPPNEAFHFGTKPMEELVELL